MAEYIAEPQAKILADSISPAGHRLTTLQVVMHRYVLAEFNTHRAFSRNSASSRAIPSRLHRERVATLPAKPSVFPSKQRGMQGGPVVTPEITRAAQGVWVRAAQDAVRSAKTLDDLGVHKSVTNRLLEPFLFQTVIVSATDWDGFWEQRCSELAQPEIKAAADLMYQAYTASTPDPLGADDWHTPLIDDQDLSAIGALAARMYGMSVDQSDVERLTRHVSAARCARVSYLTHAGVRDVEDDLTLYNRLVHASPPHYSPLEHVATPCPTKIDYDPNPARGENVVLPVAHGHQGNFTGWDQLRGTLDMTFFPCKMRLKDGT